jgi:hypothetical protein
MENGIPGPFARPGDFFWRENVRGMLLPVKLNVKGRLWVIVVGDVVREIPEMDWFLPMEEEP